MSNAAAGRTKGLADLAIAGERGRIATARFATIGADLASALRRALPFLARKRVPIAIEPARCILFEDLGKQAHSRAFATLPAGVSGVLAIDDVALARIFEGVLGAGSKAAHGGLTAAQNALSSRLSEGMARCLSVATSKLGVTLDASAKVKPPSGAAVVVALVIDGGGAIQIALPVASIVQDEETPREAPATCDAIARAMFDVEVDVVAELGRIRLPINALCNLKIGDVLRLALPLDERARVGVGGTMLFQGRPTTSGEQVAIAVDPPEPSATAVKDVTGLPIPIRHAA
jgi:flagellar motor switch protein FliM